MAIITHLVMDTVHTVLGNPTLTLILTCGILSLYTALLKIQSAFKLPPGPFGFPIFGILPLIRKEFHLTLYDYSKQYGKIMAMKMGIENVVVLSDYYLIKKAFSSRDFVARPKTELQSLLKGFGKFILQDNRREMGKFIDDELQNMCNNYKYSFNRNSKFRG